MRGVHRERMSRYYRNERLRRRGRGRYLDESTVVTVPHYSLHTALVVLLKPRAKLMVLHRRSVADAQDSMRHQNVERILLTAQT